MFWWLFTASLPLRGSSEGHAVQSEPAEHLMGLWCCTAECVLFNLIKMLFASRDIVNLPNKKDTPLPKATSSASTRLTHSTTCTSSALPRELPAVKGSGRAWGGCEPFGASPSAPQCLGSSKLSTAARLCSSSALAGTQCHTGGRAGSKVNDLHNLLAGVTAEVWKNTPLLVHQGADNRVGSLGEHPKGNKGRLSVIFITDTLVWLEKVVTVQEAFSVFSRFSITEGINPKPKQPLLTKILLVLFILLPCCSLWSFSLLACFSWYLKHHQMVAVDS